MLDEHGNVMMQCYSFAGCYVRGESIKRSYEENYLSAPETYELYMQLYMQNTKKHHRVISPKKYELYMQYPEKHHRVIPSAPPRDRVEEKQEQISAVVAYPLCGAPNTSRIDFHADEPIAEFIPANVVSIVDDPKTSRLHPGFGIAYRYDVLVALGGLFDISILGSGDLEMMDAILGLVPDDVVSEFRTPQYHSALLEWQRRSLDVIRRDLGYVCGNHIIHVYHGTLESREYDNRWVYVCDLDPERHLTRRLDGVLVLCDLDEVGQTIRDRVRGYFMRRSLSFSN
jgi:hypothetical protein